MLKTADNWRKSEMSEELKPGSQGGEQSPGARSRASPALPAPHGGAGTASLDMHICSQSFFKTQKLTVS